MTFYRIMNRILVFLLFFFFHTSLNAQNLVNNPSFEDYHLIYHPVCQNDSFPVCMQWYSPTNGSPDYDNKISCFSDYNGVPYNGIGFQFPKDVNGYWGLGVITVSPSPSYHNDREYIQSKLLDSLKGGIEYCVSLYVSLSDSAWYAADGVEVLFSDTAITDSSSLFYVLLPYNAQVKSSGIISDKTNWTHISGSFIAKGGEQYITIGNFKDDEHTDTLRIKGSLADGYTFSYYYVDAVSVYPCDTTVYTANAGGDRKICAAGESVSLGTNNKHGYKYFWYNENGNLLDTTGYLTVAPDKDCIYYLKVIDFTFNESWDTVHVTIGCEGKVYVPNIFSPNKDGNNDKLYIRGQDISEISFSIYDRWGELVFETKNINEWWDGTYKGKDCTMGVYFYLANVTFENGETAVRKGNVTLVR
jgi:gliding motility-associated-like protein